MTPELASKRLYIVDLAQRQLAMECGSTAMHALTYRVLAKLLRQAAAGLPEPALRQLFATLSANNLALLDEALQARHFDQHGRLRGTLAAPCQAVWLAGAGAPAPAAVPLKPAKTRRLPSVGNDLPQARGRIDTTGRVSSQRRMAAGRCVRRQPGGVHG